MDILAIAGYISAIVTICGVGFKLIKTVIKINNQLEHFTEQLDKNTYYIMKLALFDDSLPLTDRLHAGEIYIAMGGNGLGKKKYEQLLKKAE